MSFLNPSKKGNYVPLPTNLLTNKADLPSFPDVSSWLQGSYPFHADILATSLQEQNMAHLKTWYVSLSIKPCEVCQRGLYDIAKRATVSILCTTQVGSWDTSNKGMVDLNSMF